ncbi:MAG: aldo/keto reductase [SAR202 cluster bacterium]|nr:aldo/keto reductase [SAR202 cluster bacterium]
MNAVTYRKLGRTGLKVSNLCLGSDNFGNQYGADESTSHRILAHAIEDGINFIDTADVYAGGRSEEVIGNFLARTGRRKDLVITSKFRMGAPGATPGPNEVGASRKHAMDAIEGTLKRLRTDHVDLYLVHAWDPSTPLEETLRALDDIVRQGKARYVGCSNYPAWVVMKSLWLSDVRNLVRFECLQSVFNIVQPGLAEAMLPMCLEEGVAVTTYSALGSGFLTGKHPREAPLENSKFGARDRARGSPLTKRYWDDLKFDVVDKLKSIAQESGQPIARLSLQWVRETPGVTCPIIGARTEEQYRGLIEAWNGEAPPEVMEKVRKVAAEYAVNRSWTNYPPPPPAA